MSIKSKPTPTNIYELVLKFGERRQRIVYHVEEKDRQRLPNALDSREKHGFHELGGHEGLECLVNTAQISQLNVLEYLGGVQFEAEPEFTEKQWAEKSEEREASDEPVVIRLWLRGEDEPIVHDEIEYGAWCLARTCLIENDRFIEFRDEDGENVLYGTDHIDAIEMIDPFYLTEEQIETFMSLYDDKDEKTPAQPTDSTPLMTSPRTE
jgi:hypothetical protein